MSQFIQILRRFLLTIIWAAYGCIVLVFFIGGLTRDEGVEWNWLAVFGFCVGYLILAYALHRLINWILLGSQKDQMDR